MSNTMDKMMSTPMGSSEPNLQAMYQQARSNPRAFEEHIKRTNSQAYQLAMQMRNTSTPQEAIMRLAQQRGIDPNILRMLNF